MISLVRMFGLTLMGSFGKRLAPTWAGTPLRIKAAFGTFIWHDIWQELAGPLLLCLIRI